MEDADLKSGEEKKKYIGIYTISECAYKYTSKNQGSKIKDRERENIFSQIVRRQLEKLNCGQVN